MRDEVGHFLPSTKEIDGENYRLCTGPAHDSPTWLPETEKYFYRHKSGQREGKFTARCRLCANWNKLKSPGLSGTVLTVKVRPYFIEGVNRVGMVEFSRRVHLRTSTIRAVIDKDRETVQKGTVRKVMLEVISMRRKNEIRHRDSIHVGAYLRGISEKQISSIKDYYKPNGDVEMERGRRRRAA